jgi:hypothetical protein
MRTSLWTRFRQATFTTEAINALFFHTLFDGMEFTLQGREALTKQGCRQQSDSKVGNVGLTIAKYVGKLSMNSMLSDISQSLMTRTKK